MALLKSLIQRLLDSRTTPSEAGHSAMPGATKTTFLSKDESVGSWGTLNAGTAPADGYLFVNASADDNTNSEIRAQLSNLFHVSAQAPSPKGLGVTIPVSKGAAYTVEGAFVSHITVGFIKTIGGGYNRVVWRALSCLKPLSNYLPKVSSRAKSLGLEHKLNPLKLRSHLLLRTTNHTLRLLTAGYVLETLQLHPQVFMPRLQRSPRGMVLHLLMCPLGKVRQSFAISLLTQGKQRDFSFQQSVQTKLQTGGALC